jgi:AraC-like DNA-binding protein
MREAVVPLFAEGGQLAGFVMIGQFRSDSASDLSPYAEQWKQVQGNNALQEGFEQSTVIPAGKIETLLEMFRHLLELIIRSRLIYHKDYDIIAPVIEKMRLSPQKAMSLVDAARITARSPSTVTRFFKKITGLSFKQYQTSFRLQLAEDLLKNQPALPIAAVAQEVGFDDPFYFSRIFHKHMGYSPRACRENSKTKRKKHAGNKKSIWEKPVWRKRRTVYAHQ